MEEQKDSEELNLLDCEKDPFECEASEACEHVSGAEVHPFKLAIIGAGPGGMAILIRATRLGLLEELLAPGKSHAGIALLEAGNEAVLGCGKLGTYQINSNTYAGKFVSSVVDDQPNGIPPEQATGTILESLRGSPAAAALRTHGVGPAPLPEVGAWLGEVGQLIAKNVRQHPGCNVFTQCKVINAELVSCQTAEEGETRQLWRVLCETPIHSECGLSPLASTCEVTSEAAESGVEGMEGATRFHLYTEKLVLATGGSQVAHFDSPAVQAKTMCSDYALTTQGHAQLVERLEKGAGATKGKLCIVGASHSGFSVAWKCLYGLGESQQSKNQTPPADTCTSLEITPCTSNNTEKVNMPAASANSIVILRRGPVKVFYASRREARIDGYADSAPVTKAGQVHPFGGLRGDAKALYGKVRKQQEPRIRLVQVKDEGGSVLKKKIFEESAAVVWCCGYITNHVPLAREGVAYKVVEGKGQVEVDDWARVLYTAPGTRVKEHIPNCQAVGLGYGLAAESEKREHDNASVRADGVAVYQKRAASLVLFTIMGQRVFGQGNYTWEDRMEACRRKFGVAHSLSPPPPSRLSTHTPPRDKDNTCIRMNNNSSTCIQITPAARSPKKSVSQEIDKTCDTCIINIESTDDIQPALVNDLGTVEVHAGSDGVAFQVEEVDRIVAENDIVHEHIVAVAHEDISNVDVGIDSTCVGDVCMPAHEHTHTNVGRLTCRSSSIPVPSGYDSTHTHTHVANVHIRTRTPEIAPKRGRSMHAVRRRSSLKPTNSTQNSDRLALSKTADTTQSNINTSTASSIPARVRRSFGKNRNRAGSGASKVESGILPLKVDGTRRKSSTISRKLKDTKEGIQQNGAQESNSASTQHLPSTTPILPVLVPAVA